MIRAADIRPCPNCASRVVPVSNCNTCGSVAVRPDVEEVDRRIACVECGTENPTLFVCEKCNNRFLFEEVAGPAKEKFACILCGTFVEVDAKSCPACGAIFEEESKPATAAPRKQRPKRRVRGEFADPDVDEIARIPGVGRAKAEALCRAGFNALWKIKRATDEEIGRIKAIGPRGAKTIKDSLRFILLLPRRKSKEEVLSEEFTCPLCACVTSLFAKSCKDCGAEFDEEEIDDAIRKEVEKEADRGLLAFYDVHLEESPQDAALWYARALLLLDLGEFQEALRSIDGAIRLDPSRRSMIVRSRVLSSMKDATKAAEALRGTLGGLIEEGEARVEVAADEEVRATSDALEALTSLAVRECPTCGEGLLPDARVCPACGAKVEPVPAPSPELGLEALEEEPPVPPPEPEPAAEPELTPEPEEVAALSELERMFAAPPRPEPPPEPEEPAEAAPKETPEAEEFEEEVSVEEAPEPAPPPAPPPPARRPIEAPRPRAREFASPQARARRGLINGKGLINGSGRVNGLVNGLGFMDSSALTEFRLPQRSLLLRYGIVAGSLLLAFAVAASLFPAPPGNQLAIAIDGNPGDWTGIPKYADPSPAPDPNVAIQVYGVYPEGNFLSFLVQVSGQALGDPAGYDAFYAFIDTDASAATGFQVGGLGADYVAQVYGGTGRVASATLFAFPPNAELNWSRRLPVAGISAAASGSSLEFGVRTDDLAGFSATGSTILIGADDFDGAASRAGAAITATFGAVRIRQVPLLSVVPSGTAPALRLDISAVGVMGASDSWTVGPFSFSSTTGLTVTPSSIRVTLTPASPSASVTVSVSAIGLPLSTPLAVSLLAAPAPRPITVVGEGLEAYYVVVPPGIRVDGLFLDWTARGTADTDPVPIVRGSLDIARFGGAANASGTFFMLQVAGPLYEGSLAPQKLVPAPGGGGGGTSAPPLRVTGEDLARVYIDSNSSDSAGLFVAGIYADTMVEVRGANGRLTSQAVFRWQSGWVPAPTVTLQVAKNATALEGSLGLNPATLNATEMVFETTDWSNVGDVTNVLLTRSSGPPGGTRGAPTLGPMDGSDAATAVAKPLSGDPTVDGDCSDSVYSGAGTFSDTGIAGKAGTSGSYVYICVDVTADGDSDGADEGRIYFDALHDGGTSPQPDDRRFAVFSGTSTIVASKGDGSTWVACDSSCDAGDGASGAFSGAHEVYEFKIRFTDVWGTDTPSAGQEAGFAVRAIDASGGGVTTWGSTSPPSDTNPATWGHIDAPEFQDIAVPLAGVLVLFVLFRRRRAA